MFRVHTMSQCQFWIHGKTRCDADATHRLGRRCQSGHVAERDACNYHTQSALAGRTLCRPCGLAGVGAFVVASEPVRLRVTERARE